MQGLLVGMTTMLAMRTGHEELAVTSDEAGEFLKAAQNVARHYSVETTQRTLDWIAFVGVSAQVFGTRAVAVMVKSRRESSPAPVRAAPPATNGLNGANPPSYVPSVPPGDIEDDSFH
jgi:hypothetical protein